MLRYTADIQRKNDQLTSGTNIKVSQIIHMKVFTDRYRLGNAKHRGN